MKKIGSILCYTISLLLVSATIFRLILYIPPVQGDSRYVPFAILSAIFSLLIGAMVVAFLAIISHQDRT